MLTACASPIPANEAARIKALQSYEVLDTAPEIEFDAISRIAAHALSTPIAVVAMLDANRLWFKSKIGLDIPQLDRRIAFCAHSIMAPKAVLVVEDLSADERFRDNPLVLHPPKLRFYAGAPIVDSDGYALGTVAVIDLKPRKFTEAERVTLADLSAVVMTALQGRQRALDLARLAMTDHLTKIGNRARFEIAVAAEIAKVGRGGGGFAILSMDLDGFKEINDTHGHAAGDAVLCWVARRLSVLARAGDTLARLGGDEFALLSPACDEDAARRLAERIALAVREPVLLASGEAVRVGVSVGIANCRDTLVSVDALLLQADRALYRAKNRMCSQLASPSCEV